ncbi:DUF2478 domain-containing protein [Pseudorhodobacter sp. E13]|uniref:DUF2478 domain-containing protein n=1 Tax=Pseudorhodobacter sp. E13 TaxID=2487931 RepID=UPI000F8CE1E9|nr:DUF2478 domain-containing protein [Pseudorhodobacter sp. E13]RUS58927.1 DUF2478 domain-containing protein [Pseudorhodobacter sp. E13]
MLGYVTGGERGQMDLLLADTAARLRAEGCALAGVVQVNEEFDPARPCHMDLHVLNGTSVIRISQDLGTLSKGCRLDPSALEQAVGLVAQALEAGPALLIINKFGRQEAEGRGFRPLIGQALAAAVPVLTAVSAGYLDAFERFAEGMGTALPCETDAVLAFCHAQIRHQIRAQTEE